MQLLEILYKWNYFEIKSNKVIGHVNSKHTKCGVHSANIFFFNIFLYLVLSYKISVYSWKSGFISNNNANTTVI